MSRVLLPMAPVNRRVADGAGLARRLTGAHGVVLSFDDGPHPEGTPAVMEILARRNVRAMFFLVGEQVLERPALARELHAAGHLVALHAHRHRFQPRLAARTVQADVARGRAVIEDAIGAPVAWHRPPYGAYSPAGLDAVRGAGLTPLLWSRWGKDWRRFTTPPRIAARATRQVSDGDVILLHDADFYSARRSHRRTVAALPAILDELNRCGLGTVLPG